MKVELKNVKIAEHLSEETTAFTATLYIDGKRAGDCRNQGHGGPNMVHVTDSALRQQFNDYIKSLPPDVSQYGSLPMSADMFIGGLLDVHYMRKITKGDKRTLFKLKSRNIPKGEWLEIKSPWNADTKKALQIKYGEDLGPILNELIANGEPTNV